MFSTWIVYLSSYWEVWVSIPECLNAVQTSIKANITCLLMNILRPVMWCLTGFFFCWVNPLQMFISVSLEVYSDIHAINTAVPGKMYFTGPTLRISVWYLKKSFKKHSWCYEDLIPALQRVELHACLMANYLRWVKRNFA